MLYGSGEQSLKSNSKFYNTYGTDFTTKFDKERQVLLDSKPDHPIDMKFFDSLSTDFRQKIQFKFPHSRFLLNNEQALEVTLKLFVQYIKLTNSSNMQFGDKKQLIKSLKFITECFLKFKDFDKLDIDSD